MMVWAFVILLVLLIPLLAIVIDSQVGQALADRISGRREIQGDLHERLEALEGEIRYLNESVESLREESSFLRSLVEGRDEEEPRLGPGPDGSGAAPPGAGD